MNDDICTWYPNTSEYLNSIHNIAALFIHDFYLMKQSEVLNNAVVQGCCFR